MDGSTKEKAEAIRRKAVASFDAFFSSNERSQDFLLEAVNYCAVFCKERGILIPELNGKSSKSETLVALLWQCSLIADELFTIREQSLCCQLIEAALEMLDHTSKTEGVHYPPKSTLMLKLSSSYLQLNKWQDSIKTAQLCLKAGIKQGSKLLEMQSSIILANAYQRECSYVEAIFYNSKMLDIGRQLTASEKEQVEWCNQLECKILWNISACFNSINDFENALIYAKEYLYTVTYGSEENLKSILSYTAKLECLLGHYPEALYMYELELAICKRFQDKKGKGKAYGNIGLVYASMGNEVLSRQYLNQQFLIAKTLEDSEVLLDATNDQSESYMRLGKLLPAIESFKSLLKLAREHNLWDVQCSAYRNIGKMYQTQGTLNFARHFLSEAMHRAADLGLKDEEIDAQMHFAQVLQALGYHQKARKHFKEVVIYFETLVDKLHHYEITPCTTIAEKLNTCCRDLKDVLVKLGRYNEALEIAELNKSRVYFKVVNRKNAKSDTIVGEHMPLTYESIQTSLNYLPKDCIVLYYAMSSDGFHLWMMAPERGTIKFVTQHCFSPCPIETLVRDCVRSISVTNKGNRCCYDSECRRKILKQANENKVGGVSRDVFKHIESNMENKVVQDGCKSQNHIEEDIVELESDCITLATQAAQTKVKVHPGALWNANKSTVLENENIDLVQTVDFPNTTKHFTSLRGKSYSTPDSGYESCLSPTIHSRGATEYVGATEADQKARSDSVSCSKEANVVDNGNNSIAENSYEGLLEKLFTKLLGKVEHFVSSLSENTHLVFIPDGILHMVPFHLLRNKKKEPLHRRFLVSVLPCLAAVFKQNTSLMEISTSVAIGNSTLNDAMLRNINGDVLSQESDNSKEELSLVSRILGIRAISGKEATKDAFLRVLPSADIAYITSIGSVSERYILLTPNTHRECTVAEDASYIVDMNDIAYLELKARLLILSGCNQCPHGLSEMDTFNLDLATGFIGAGAAAVVVFLHSVPHKAQLYIVHRLFKLMEMGNSVCQALRELYNEMSASEDMSHPGYWGGIILVGRDVFIDVKSVRKKALEHTINESTQRIRNSLTIDDNRLDLDDYNLEVKASMLQSLLGTILMEKRNSMVLESLSTLLALSCREMVDFAKQELDKKLPAVRIDNELLTMNSVKQLLSFLGYETEGSIEKKDVTFVVLPCWNFDNILGRTLGMLQSLQGIRSLSEKATFSLSQCLADLDFDALNTIIDTISTLHLNPDKQVFTTDLGVRSLWVSPKIKRFLQDIGFIEINMSLSLRDGMSYHQLRVCTIELVSALLSMYEDGKLLMSHLRARKVQRPAPWMTEKPNRSENRTRNLLARRIVMINDEFKELNEIGSQWKEATVQSFKPPNVETIEIGTGSKEEEKGERHYNGVLKVKVKQGGTPSSTRFPVIDKRNVTKCDRYRQREKLERAFLEKKKNVSRRKMFEIYTSFAMSGI